MNVSILLIDFGLVILAWMVQLIIYPGFTYYAPADIKRWHTLYTKRISILVIPLMIGQLVLHGLLLAWQPQAASITSALLIAIVWAITFLQAVPLHNMIASNNDTAAIAHQLEKVNRLRTMAWTIIFILTLSYFY